MVIALKNKKIVFKLVILVFLAGLCFAVIPSHVLRAKAVPKTLEGRVMEFASKYPNEDCIFIVKSKHIIYYCKNGQIVRNVNWCGFDLNFPAPIAIGMGGRYETPVGEYYICQKTSASRYTLFLGLSWPNVADVNRAVELGYRLNAYDCKRIIVANALKLQPPWDTAMGGSYGIHGAPTYMKYAVDRMERANPNLIYVTKRDNTRGCVAIEHRYLRFLFANVDEGTPVQIVN